MSYPNLSKAPIVEGLISIHVKPKAGVSVADLTPFRDRLRSYPTVKDLREFLAQIVFAEDPDSLPPSRGPMPIPIVGIRFERTSPNFVVHVKTTELLISRLRPYDSWDILCSEAKAVWEIYRDILQPEAITRLATRYINKVELPLEGLDFDEYLSTPARIPKGLPQVLDNFMTRVAIPDIDSGSRIVISQVLEEPNANAGTISVLLDIDVFKHVDFEISSSESWRLLDRMRDLKNRAFFDSVTQKTLDLYK